MTKFRLKKEARPFYNEGHSNRVESLNNWAIKGVDIKALEEVEENYISYGHLDDNMSGGLCGWGQDEGGRFRFTLNIPSMSGKDYLTARDAVNIASLMDKIQEVANKHFGEVCHD